MARAFLRHLTALTLIALILAAHLPLPGAAAASGLACCGPKACCEPARGCTSGGACATQSDPASTSPTVPGLPTLLAGNCADPTTRVAPVSYDPVTQTQHVAVRVDLPMVNLDAAPLTTGPACDATPSVPPPRA
jgi:hypothetical protein